MSLQVQIKKKLGSFRLNVDFETERKMTGLLGASGSGKSYTLKCIAGIETPDSGRIVLDGKILYDSEQKINLAPQKRNVGYLFQNYALFENMSVEANILCGLHGEPDRKQRMQEVKDAIRLFGLNGLEKQMPRQLSGGQAQRVALARILVSKPRLLMLDEPFSALDSHLRGRLQTELRSLLEPFAGQVLMVTHSRDEAYHMCQHIGVMENGSLLTAKDTKELFADPESVCAARITGCKNISAARKCGEYEVEALDWGVRFVTGRPVGDGIRAVGIRAHYFHESTRQAEMLVVPVADAREPAKFAERVSSGFNSGSGQNAHRVVFTDQMEGPFEWILQFRFEGQREDTEPLWWRVPKSGSLQTFPDMLCVAPEEVLLLYR